MENKLILSIGRQVGSGGLSVARALSEDLGIKLYDSELLAEAARHSGLNASVFERRDEKGSRHLKSVLSFRSLLGGTTNSMNNSVMADEETFKIQSNVMRKIASEGPAIFVGRCADYILRDDQELFTVFITAPIEERIARVAQLRGISEKDAAKYIEKTERSRAEYYNYYTFKRWGEAASYDLCVDSSKIGGVEGTVEFIKTALKLWQTKR